MKDITLGSKILFIGMTGSGKSVLVKDYLYHNRRSFPLGIVISPTELVNKTFTPHIPQVLIHDCFSDEILKEYFNRQEDIVAKIESDSRYKDVNPHSFCIMDDCLADRKIWSKSKNLEKIFFQGRHYKITFLMTTQYSKGIPANFRNNINYVFICYTSKTTELKKLYDEYCGMFTKFEDFRAIFNKFTENYGCMVINAQAKSTKLEDQVFMYRSNLMNTRNGSTFKMCYDELWLVNNKTRDKKDSEIEVEKKKFKYIYNNSQIDTAAF
jgi:hypothetical protein